MSGNACYDVSIMLRVEGYESYDDLMFSGDDEVTLLGVVVWFQAAKEEGA